MEITLSLPYPPSANRAWRNVKGRTLLSKAAREHRRAVAEVVATERLAGLLGPADRLAVHITVIPPDRARRDLDNVRKLTFDALTHAGVWADDSQIDQDSAERADASPGGGLIVRVRVIPPTC